MKLGLNVSNYTWPNGPTAIASDLARVAKTAEDGGFDRLSVMDHLWQIEVVGPPEHEMLESYTTLGYVAGQTSKIKLLTLVTGVVYRDPGLLAKAVTTLDVLSEGRAMLGIGAAWYREEAEGLGLFFPPLGERFERLEEALQICLAMWSDSNAPYEGTYYQLGRTLNAPQAISRPHPPILIGGAGEKKTLRLVAKYAQACNLLSSLSAEERTHKLEVLREHCANEGRNYDDIEKTATCRFNVGERGERVGEMIDQLEALSRSGISVAHGSLVPGGDPIKQLEILGELVAPIVATFEPPSLSA